eukprot:COSAG04_NODE_1027_length_8681_cov_106.498019_3_plen_580_part_00
MNLNVATPVHRGATLWLVMWHCLLPLLAAQTTSRAEDTGVLLEAKAAADTSACTGGSWYGGSSAPCPLDSWTADTEPCGEGYNNPHSGWVGVMCDARGGLGGRVVAVNFRNTGVGGELLPFFGRLGGLWDLALAGNPALRGDVADLAGATELRLLDLSHCLLVVGEVAALAALVHLGEEYPKGSGIGGSGGLGLAGSGVHGPVAALRALPGLGAEWGPEDGRVACTGCNPHLAFDFTPCSAFGGQQAGARYSIRSSQYVFDIPWGTGSPGCAAAGLAPVLVSRPLFRLFHSSALPAPLSAPLPSNTLSSAVSHRRLSPEASSFCCALTRGPLAFQEATNVAGRDECACCGPDAPRGHFESGGCIPIDCAGSWSGCNSECVWTTWTETAAPSVDGAACPSAPSCPAGQGDCPPDIDCAGSWSDCTAKCEAANERVWHESMAQSGDGAACPPASPCSPGDGDCPPDIDCAGTWSTCTDDCTRTWSQAAAQSGQGAACPTSGSCMLGEDSCPSQPSWVYGLCYSAVAVLCVVGIMKTGLRKFREKQTTLLLTARGDNVEEPSSPPNDTTSTPQGQKPEDARP